MCPSYQVTHEEEHSTRGRARLLFEMLDGHGDSAIRDGWRSDAVRDALDLCLACKGCKTDCPADVDMATYKAEFLAHHYAGRLRARCRTTPWAGCPLWPSWSAGTRLGRGQRADRTPRRCAGPRWRLAGIDGRARSRCSPRRRCSDWFAAGRPARRRRRRGAVLLWPDTFTNHFHPHIGQAGRRGAGAAGLAGRAARPSRCAAG